MEKSVTIEDSIYSKNDDKFAIIMPEGPKFSYKEFKAEIRNLTPIFENQGGNCVVLALPNGPEVLTLFFAASSAGCHVLCLNPSLTSEELKYYMDDTKAAVVIVPINVPDDYSSIQAANLANIPIWKVTTEDKKNQVKYFRIEEFDRRSQNNTQCQRNRSLLSHQWNYW